MRRSAVASRKRSLAWLTDNCPCFDSYFDDLPWTEYQNSAVWCILQDDVRRFLSIFRQSGRLSTHENLSIWLRQEIRWDVVSWRVGVTTSRRWMYQQPENISQQSTGTQWRRVEWRKGQVSPFLYLSSTPISFSSLPLPSPSPLFPPSPYLPFPPLPSPLLPLEVAPIAATGFGVALKLPQRVRAAPVG